MSIRRYHDVQERGSWAIRPMKELKAREEVAASVGMFVYTFHLL